jgi:hypothetical protein
MGVNHGGLIPTAAPGTGGGGGGGVTSFNTRTGAVVPATADYLAVPTGGLTGATTATRYVGGTTVGPPTTGTFAVGDFVVDQTATIWVCVVASPSAIWSPTIQSSLVNRSATATAGPGEITIFGASGASGQTITLPHDPVNGSLYQIKNISSYPVNILGNPNSLSVSGVSYGASTPYTIPTNCAYTFNFSGGVWYCFVTTDLGAMGNYGALQLEQAIRLQSLDQMSPPAADLSMNARRLINVATPLFPTDAATGYAGMSTVTGAPTTGTWNTGNYVVDGLGRIYTCTAGGTPGTWVAGASVGASFQSFSDSSAATAYTANTPKVHLVSNALAVGTYMVTGQIAIGNVANVSAGLWFTTASGVSAWQGTPSNATPVARIGTANTTVFPTGTVSGILKVTTAGTTVSLVSESSSSTLQYAGTVPATGTGSINSPAILLTIVPIA